MKKYSDAEIERMIAELERLKAELGQASAEIKRLTAENQGLRRTVTEAKDPSPIKRCSFKRVAALATSACMTLKRLRSGWLLKLGHLERRCRSLREIWEILIADDWELSSVFPAEIKPRFPKRHPTLAPAFAP